MRLCVFSVCFVCDALFDVVWHGLCFLSAVRVCVLALFRRLCIASAVYCVMLHGVLFVYLLWLSVLMLTKLFVRVVCAVLWGVVWCVSCCFVSVCTM